MISKVEYLDYYILVTVNRIVDSCHVSTIWMTILLYQLESWSFYRSCNKCRLKLDFKQLLFDHYVAKIVSCISQTDNYSQWVCANTYAYLCFFNEITGASRMRAGDMNPEAGHFRSIQNSMRQFRGKWPVFLFDGRGCIPLPPQMRA